MVMLADCIPCQYGDHDHHHEVVQAVPEGMMGGARCPCKGECRGRKPPEAEIIDSFFDAHALDEFDALATGFSEERT